MPKNTAKHRQDKQLTIGFVVDDGMDHPDGVQQYILTLGEWFVSKGHEVHYLAGETQPTDIPNVHSMSRNLKVRFNGNTLSTPFPASAKKIRKLLETYKFDVLHVQVPYSPFMAARVVNRAFKQTTIVGTFHILPFGRLQALGTRLLGVWLGRNLKRFQGFVGVSTAAQSFAYSSFRVRAGVIPNPVVIEKFKPQKPRQSSDEIRIVFLGRLVERKGCLQLLRALDIVQKQKLTNKKFRLDIYGRGIDAQKLEQFSRQSGLHECVQFHGFVSEADKPKALQAADLAVFPSTGAESFGIVLIEAMAAEAGVVLGGDNPGYRTVLGETPEALVEPKDSQAFAESLARFINDETLRSRIHDKQQAMVQQYDINVVGEQVLGLYEDCKKRRQV